MTAAARMNAVVPLVLLPGLSGSCAHDFAFLAPVLARDREVIGIDLPPHATDPVAHVLAALPDGPFDLVGYSLGAVVAAQVAAVADVRNLVLVAGLLESGPRQRRFAATWNALPDDAREEFALFAASSTDDAHLLSFRSEQVARFAAATAPPAITAPTLVIGCAHDAIATPEQSRSLFAAIPDSRYTEIDAGHAVLGERPAEVLSHIEGFLNFPERYPAARTIDPACV
jgi:pimeloyl-ACP methyl ester carboxylesterase